MTEVTAKTFDDETLRGEQWSYNFVYETNTTPPVPISLLGARVQMVVEDKTGTLIVDLDHTEGQPGGDAGITFVDPVNGEFSIVVATDALGVGVYQREIWITPASNGADCVADGRWRILDSVRDGQ
jgi:hypothetical protein